MSRNLNVSKALGRRGWLALAAVLALLGAAAGVCAPPALAAPPTGRVAGVVTVRDQPKCVALLEQAAGTHAITNTTDEATQALCEQLLGAAGGLAPGVLAPAEQCLAAKISADAAMNMQNLVGCVTPPCVAYMQPSSDKANALPNTPTPWAPADLATLCANMISAASQNPGQFGKLIGCVSGEIGQGIGEPDDSQGPAYIVVNACAGKTGCTPVTTPHNKGSSLDQLLDDLSPAVQSGASGVLPGGTCSVSALAAGFGQIAGGITLSVSPSPSPQAASYNIYVISVDSGQIIVGTQSDASQPSCNYIGGGNPPCPNTPVTILQTIGPASGYPSLDQATAAYCQDRTEIHMFVGGWRGTVNGTVYWIDNALICPGDPTE